MEALGHAALQLPFFAFEGTQRVARGALHHVLARGLDLYQSRGVMPLFFDGRSGAQVDFDLRGSLPDVLARVVDHPHCRGQPLEQQVAKNTGPGRPRLGVVSREVSLLPRHWTWLEQQPGGISAALRKMVEAAARQIDDAAETRARREAVHRFATVVAGDLPGFEAACRALFAGDVEAMQTATQSWPPDVRQQMTELLEVSSYP